MKILNVFFLAVIFASTSFSQWTQTFLCGDDNINAIVRAGNYLFAGTDYNAVWRSADDGLTWTKMDNGITESHYNALIYAFNKLFVGTDYGIYQSTDLGTSWSKINNTGFDWNTVNYFQFDGTILFVATFGDGVFKSTDGITFTEINTGLPTEYIYNLQLKNGKLFAGLSGSGVFVTTNNGSSWSAANTGIESRSIKALTVSNNSLFVGSTYGIYRSDNDGGSWTQVSSLLEAESFAVYGNYIFSGNYIYGIWCSSDNGANWIDICATSGPTDQTIRAILIDNGYIHTGDEDGKMYRRPLSQVTSLANDFSGVSSFTLEQNFPNPFNPNTTIKFTLPTDGNITLKIFSISGELVTTAAEEFYKAGEHIINLDAEGLSGGTYFYQLFSGDVILTKKMILLK